MSGPIEFTDNYEDLSTDKGFQFKFRCECCGNGYMSSYQVRALGVAGSALDVAGKFFGGMFGTAASSAYQIQQAVGGKAHDEALRAAVAELRPKFVQCRRCGNWMCREVCFNQVANMCKRCAPVAEQEETALRARHVQTEVSNDLAAEEEARLEAKKAKVQAKCRHCGAPTFDKKFCPECGKPTTESTANCPQCGAKAAPGAKFCGECGAGLTPAGK